MSELWDLWLNSARAHRQSFLSSFYLPPTHPPTNARNVAMCVFASFPLHTSPCWNQPNILRTILFIAFLWYCPVALQEKNASGPWKNGLTDVSGFQNTDKSNKHLAYKAHLCLLWFVTTAFIYPPLFFFKSHIALVWPIENSVLTTDIWSFFLSFVGVRGGV